MSESFWSKNGLTYCANIHPGDTLPEVMEAIVGPMARLKSELSPDSSFPVGLRLSARTIDALQDERARASFASTLAEQALVPITMNGFPYGPFHGTRVKEDVYLPDWRSEERVRYTNALADLMAELAGDGRMVSLSTVPGAFKQNGIGAEVEMAGHFVETALHCARLEQEIGCTVAIAIEPEPCCFMETIEEAVAFFEGHLFAPAAIRRVAAELGIGRGEAQETLRRHLGLCYDVCHAAVEYEDPAQSIARLRGAGIGISKLQLSAALRVPEVNDRTRAALAEYAEPTYLHQVVARGVDGELRRHVDLGPALALGDASDGEEWRIHFHVPIFMADLGAFCSTQDFLSEILTLHRETPIAPHLEVETYTWGVLPDGMRGASIEEDIARELNWVRSELS